MASGVQRRKFIWRPYVSVVSDKNNLMLLDEIKAIKKDICRNDPALT